MLCKYIIIDRRQTLLLTVTKKNIVNNVQTLQKTVIYVYVPRLRTNFLTTCYISRPIL